MRILAIDPGTERIGLALSDPLGVIAQPLEFVPAKPAEAVLARLASIIREKAVERILVGMPRNMDGSYGPAAEEVRRFIETIRPAVGVPIKAWDERLTSSQANRSLVEAGVRRGERKKRVDAVAAALLLQSYLDAGGPAMPV